MPVVEKSVLVGHSAQQMFALVADVESHAVKTIVGKAYGYMNNHADAKSVANAIQLRQLLGEPVPEDLHPEMLKRYPALKEGAVPVTATDTVPAPVRAH